MGGGRRRGGVGKMGSRGCASGEWHWLDVGKEYA
jgi:hypothetical protein